MFFGPTGGSKNILQWDVCKSPGFPSNRVAAGQVDPPAVRITMVCSLFACCLSASEAFLFLSGAVCWVFSNAYTKEEHLLVFFVASDRRRAGVTRRRRPLVDCATPPRHLSKKQKSKSLGLNNVPAWLKIYIGVHGELFTGCAVRLQSKSAKSTAQVSNGQLRKGLVKIVKGCYSRLKAWLELEK